MTIERATESQDSFGEPDVTWSALVTRWMSMEPAEGREFFTAKHDVSENKQRFRVRWDPIIDTVTAKDRLTMDGGARVFDIQSPPVNLDGRDREVHIFATEQQ